MGYEFSLELLSAASKTPPDALSGLLDEAIVSGFIAPVPGAPNLYMFARAVIRAAICEELSGLKLAAIHREVGLAFDARARAVRSTNARVRRTGVSMPRARAACEMTKRKVSQWS
jgi:hypothetical protein